MTQREQEGAVAVEFALILPILLVLVFGIIEFSLILYDKAMITNASREGARAGIVFSDPLVPDQEIIAIVNTYCHNNLITFGAQTDPTTTVARAGSDSGDPLTVSVSYTYTFSVLPNFVTGLLGTIPLVAETVMRME